MREVSRGTVKVRFGLSQNSILIALIIACALLFSYLSVARHYTFNTSAYDLAMYDQAVWNTSQGRPFEINLLEDTMPGLTNKLGDHVEPILLPLALLYKIRSNADVLLVVQAIALAALIWPLYQLVHHRSKSIFLASLGVVLYLVHPAMWNALLFDFHPVTLAAAFLVFALWMLIQKKRSACLIFALLAMMGKENIGLMVAMLGVYAALFVKGERRLGLILIGVGVIGAIIAVGFINPAFQPAGVSYYLNRYGKLGSTFGEVLLSPFTKFDVFWSIIAGPKRLAYYGDLLLPLGGLPLLGLDLILIVLPDIALNTLSAFAPSRTLDYHYAILIAPFLILATLWGLDRLARWLTRINLAKVFPHHQRTRICPSQGLIYGIAGAIVLLSMAAYQIDHYHTFLPLSDRYAGTFAVTPRDAIGLQVAAQIPAEAVVSAQFNLLPHVSQRERAHIYPRIEDATYVFLDTQGQIEPFKAQAEYQNAVDTLRSDSAFEVMTERDGFILLRRK